MSTKKKESPTYTREGYFRALALDTLSSHAHELSNMLDDISAASPSADELSNMYSQISSELHAEARQCFPRYPHDDHIEGSKWAREQGIAP